MATNTVSSKTLPGPSALPLLGAKANMAKTFTDIWTSTRRLHDTYGDVVALAQGDPTNIFAFGPALNFQLLSQPTLFLAGKEQVMRGLKDPLLWRLFVPNLLNMNGEKHKQQRHLMMPAFHARQIGRYHDDMVAQTQRMLEGWRSLPQADLYEEMKRLTQRIVVKTVLGLDDEHVIDQTGKLFDQLIASMVWLTFTPNVDVPGTPYHRAITLARQWEDIFHSLVAQKRKETEATDVLAALVQAHDEDGTRLTDDELLSQVFTLYGAGHTTTSAALTWTFFLLHQHPRIHADLLAELDGTLHGEAPTFESIQRLPLLDRVIKESLRLLPPTPTSLRTTAAPCELGGFELPKGATIFYSPFLTHRLQELYEEPDRFLPQRWETLSRTPYEYLPFAAGAHRCIGAEFALLEIKVVMAMLLQQYRLAVVPNARIEPKGYEAAPAHGMPVRIIPQDRHFERIPVHGNIQRLVDFG